MEIKQGDTLRVSKDAPKIYVPVSFWTEGNSIVEEIYEGNAAICYESNYADFRIVVPIKYLLVNVNGVWKKPKAKPKRTRKVDAEAKVKCGDAVLAMKTDQISPSSRAETFRRNVSIVTKIKDGIASLLFIDKHGENHHARTAVEFLQKVDSEPTEQTEAEKKPNVGSIKIPVEVDLTDSYWDAYTADLAKEVALKVANKYNGSKEAAEYAALVAKAVVEGLKRK